MGGTLRKLRVAWGAGTVVAMAVIGCGGTTTAPHQRLADEIRQNDTALRQAIDTWRADGDPPSGPPPTEVTDEAGQLQDEIDSLSDHPDLAARVIRMLDGPVRDEIRRLYAARRALLKLSAGSGDIQLRLGPRAPLAALVSFYSEAERRFGIGANYLAAINLVETKFGRVVSNSVAGAQGPMQFIPSTWQIYGHGGDIRDPHDAILAAARLLRTNGAPARYGPALRAYNPSGLYVEAVTQYAREIAANPYALYYLYTWEP